ncbi:MAG: nucleoside-diphosphate kinase [Candidatus Margulisbacteria bacterium]|jgi:nucleoside-diphosphate kinase|nr:nucleoside-diphosphate kinase [Candidatus Margulisiibacteriota bacterium]
MIKPDGLARDLEKEILKRIELTGLRIEASRSVALTPAEAAELYQPHAGKPFYDGLIKFITSGPVTVCQIAGEDAIARLRQLMGATDPRAAAAGTIRGDLREADVIGEHGTIKNLIHGSDSPESARRELAIFFG